MRDLTDAEIAALPVVGEHTVPHAVDPYRWAFRGAGNLELADGLGGYLRAVPRSKREAELDEEYLLAGEELHRTDSHGFDAEPIEDEHEAERRRRLLERLRDHEIEPAWDHRLLSRARRRPD